MEPVPSSLFSSLFQASEMSAMHTSPHTATCLDIALPSTLVWDISEKIEHWTVERQGRSTLWIQFKFDIYIFDFLLNYNLIF